VPHFRTLAVKLGAERMSAGLDKLAYGNRDIAPDLSAFWLTGNLRISAQDQVGFVERLALRELPVSAAAQTAVRDILEQDAQGGATLFGKTGSGRDAPDSKRALTWLVGWVEKDGDVYPFALWINGDDIDRARAERTRIARAILADLDLIPEPRPAPAP
jgi:beta-lactamase class D